MRRPCTRVRRAAAADRLRSGAAPPFDRLSHDVQLELEQVRDRLQLSDPMTGPSAQWWPTPDLDQASVHSPGSQPKSTREVVLPIASSGPGTTLPSAATRRKVQP